MTVYYRVGSERLTEEEYKAKYPDHYKDMQEKRQMLRDMALPPVERVECTRRDPGDWTKDPDGARYCPQAARFPGDPQARFKGVNDFIEWGKRRDMSVDTRN